MSTFLRLLMLHFCNIRGNPALSAGLLGKDLFHASQHCAHRPHGLTVAATVFDLSCWVTPGHHRPENVAATKGYAERILKKADGLIAISERTRSDTVDLLKIPKERIRVIYPGVAAAFFAITGEQVHSARTKHKLGAPYLLFVGCIEPRKNIPCLVRAYGQLPEGLKREVELVLAGPFGWESDELRKTLMEGGQGIRYLGYVPEEDLPGIYGGAAAVVYPSLYEGFGFPAAQALAAGIPLIASNSSCLPEVVGGGGLLVNPGCAEEISAAIEKVLTDSELARTLAERGRARAENYRWELCASRSLEFFHDAGA